MSYTLFLFMGPLFNFLSSSLYFLVSPTLKSIESFFLRDSFTQNSFLDSLYYPNQYLLEKVVPLVVPLYDISSLGCFSSVVLRSILTRHWLHTMFSRESENDRTKRLSEKKFLCTNDSGSNTMCHVNSL